MLLLVCLDADFDGADYPQLPAIMIGLLTSMRTSLGDNVTPGYGKWEDMMKEGKKENNDQMSYLGFAMIVGIWAIWILMLFVMQLTLLNFLISIIGMSYDSAMVNTTYAEYNDKVEMTIQASVIRT